MSGPMTLEDDCGEVSMEYSSPLTMATRPGLTVFGNNVSNAKQA